LGEEIAVGQEEEEEEGDDDDDVPGIVDAVAYAVPFDPSDRDSMTSSEKVLVSMDSVLFRVEQTVERIWRRTQLAFFGFPEASSREENWELLRSLNKQSRQ